ncbi:hypothetical protein RSOL_302420 [Rhizoctonia solani AG-3 Rhs1AP]|uniref:MYND-type domain-containing protein n=1 Tax=Rhizoctonia solani AG-3 Rhs1AP TaxID=1086054 RepID=A0A0A1ULN7_9AGAM|nr:hypothetical protein RSOL_302420 [Rhizoctonia solani AG-3 Rhs1AP]
MVHPQHHEEVFSSYFVASHLEGDYVLLPELGGFRREDAVWLLGELWEDRKSFLQFSGSGLSSMMHGWSVVFAAMWRHIEKLQDSPELLKKLRNLLLRYALSAFNPEFKLVCNIVLLIEDQAPSTTTGYEELPPVDTDDADLILRLFMEYLNTEKRDIGPPPGDMMAFPFAMVYRTTLNTLPNQVPYFLVAVVERVWKMLGSTAPTLTLRERIVDSYEYGLNAIMSMCSALIFGDDIEPSLDAVSAWTKLLQEVNILELIGRLCSVAVVSSNSSASGFLISQDWFEMFTKYTPKFMECLKNVAQIDELGQLNDLCRTWETVLRHISLQLSFHPAGSPIQYRIYMCRSIWLNVGTTFEFNLGATYQHRCMNPRCPDPLPDEGAQYICKRCCWVHYCSQRCQSMHWNSTFIGTHRRQCMIFST